MKDVYFYKNEIKIAYDTCEITAAHAFCMGMLYVIKVNNLLNEFEVNGLLSLINSFHVNL